MKDFRTLDEATTFKDAIRLWEEGDSTLGRWMNERYIRGRVNNRLGVKE